MIGIYLITNVLDGRRYVGQSVDISRRKSFHMNGHGNSWISRSIRAHGAENFRFETLETCERDQLNDREAYWVAKLGCVAPHGYNLTTGGGQYAFTEETMVKLRHAQRNRSPEHIARKNAAAKSEATRAKISAAFKGRKHSAASIEKMRAAQAGKTFTDEARRKMSEAARRRAATPEFKAMMQKVHKGKKLTTEHRAKMSAALKNPSAETRAKLSAAASSRTHSAATLAEMRSTRRSPEWRAMCATGGKRKQSPEQIRKRVEATLATKAARAKLRPD